MEFKLSDGGSIPGVGLGTYQLRGNQGVTAVKEALQLGYRHIDTAQMYRNESIVNSGIRGSGVSREEIFITTKVWTSSLGFDQTMVAFKESLFKLGTDYVDLYLIHWPGSNNRKRLESYRAMIQLREEEKVKHVGVSNFSEVQIQEIETEFGELPAVNQFYYNFSSGDTDLVEFCQSLDIQVVGYTPLNKGRGLESGPLADIGEAYGKTGAQVALRWLIQQGICAIPKSSNSNRIAQNYGIFNFELSADEMQTIYNLKK